MKTVTTLVPQIKEQFGLNICACLGLLDKDQAQRLKDCGVDKVNHNLNTGEDYYGEICSTHTYQDRLDTLNNVRAAGLEICSGGIIGMGEKQEDVVAMAMELRGLKAESIPLNFLNPVEGTRLAGKKELNTRDCLRALCMMRFVNPTSELRIAGGREMHLGSLQPLGLYVANSLFIGDYLTTKGQAAEDDYRMIREMGFQLTVADGDGSRHPGTDRPQREIRHRRSSGAGGAGQPVRGVRKNLFLCSVGQIDERRHRSPARRQQKTTHRFYKCSIRTTG
ncbi:MAG: biotin synthase BioB [Pirellulales bacterium]